MAYPVTEAIKTEPVTGEQVRRPKASHTRTMIEDKGFSTQALWAGEEDGHPAKPKPSSAALHYQDLVGHYVNDDPWDGLVTVTEADGKLRLNGTLLESVGTVRSTCSANPTRLTASERV